MKKNDSKITADKKYKADKHQVWVCRDFYNLLISKKYGESIVKSSQRIFDILKKGKKS